MNDFTGPVTYKLLLVLVSENKCSPHLVYWIIPARLMLSDSAVVCVPPELAPNSPPSPIVSVSAAPSCEYAGVSPHPVMETNTH